MYAVIMAGGEGTRLRPLTLDRPKPLVEVAGSPAIDRILELLSRHSIKKAAITTMYLPAMIEEHCGGSYKDIELYYFREEKPLGTAGSVKNTEPLLSLDTDDYFLVISGDAVCDIDISGAARFHCENKADVTIITSTAGEPYEYGVVLSAKGGRIERFIEKPGRTQAFADTVNTGIYIISRKILALIPKDKSYDFGRDLFPRLLNEKYALYAKNDPGYWCDMGDLASLYACSIKAATEEGTITAENNIIGDGCHIVKDAEVRDSILFNRVTVGGESRVRGAIISDGVTVGRGAVVGRGCVIGSGCVVGDGAKIGPGIKIYNNVRIGNGASVMADVFFGEVKADIFGDSGIILDSDSVTAEYAVKIGCALAAAANGGGVGVMADADPLSRLTREGLICGTCSAGARCVDLSPDFAGFSAMASFAAVKLGLEAAACVYREGDKIRIDLYDRCGLYPERGFERRAAAALAGGTYKRVTPSEPERMSGLNLIYRAELSREASGSGIASLKISLGKNIPSLLLGAALSDAGVKIDDGAPLRLDISGSGLDLSATEVSDGGEYKTDRWHIAAVVERAELDRCGRGIALPVHAPMRLEKIAADSGVTVARYTSCPYDSGEREVRMTAAGQLWLRDALFMAAKLCSMLASSKKTLEQLLADEPPFNISVDDYAVAGKSPKLADIGAPAEEGVVIDYDAGRVRVIPRRSGGLRLFVDTASSEAAEEIMTLTKKRLEKLLSGGAEKI